MRKILYIARDYPPEGIGGIATYVHNVASKLSQLSDFSVTVLADTQGKDREETSGKVKIVRLHSAGNWQWYFKSAWWMFNNYKEFDYIEDELFAANIFFAKVLLGEKLKYHVNGHGSHRKTYLFESKNRFSDKLKLFLMNNMEKFVFKNSVYNLCPSKSYAEVLSFQWGYPLEKINVVNNPAAIYKPSLKIRHKEIGQKFFLYYGKLQKLKGIFYLMELIPSLLKIFPGYQFVFMGKDKDNFQEKIRDFLAKDALASLLKRIIFLDNIVDKDDLFSIVKKAEIVFIPSIYETYPYTLLECISLRKRVCCNLVGGIKDILLLTRYQNYLSLDLYDKKYDLVSMNIKNWNLKSYLKEVNFSFEEYNQKNLDRYLDLFKYYQK